MKYRITIKSIATQGPYERLEGPIQFEADAISFEQEYGIALTHGRFGQLEQVTTNGQRRFCIKGWTGCAGYDHFTTGAELY